MNKSLIKPINNQITKKKKKGFTLVELIIVIAIIAILAAIAIPKMGTVRQNANHKADIANAKNIHTAAATALIDGDITVSKDYTLGTDDAKPIKDRLDAYSKSKETPGTDFTVKVDKDGNIIVCVDNKEVYPEEKEVADKKDGK